MKGKITLVGGGGAAWGDWFQLIFAAAMIILAIILVVEGFGVLFGKKSAKKA